MASKSSKVVVLQKFDMHIHTSILTTKELKEFVTKYYIPTDLHPYHPPSEFTMNKLLPRVILFEIRCQSLDVNAVVSLFHIEELPDAMPWRHADTNLRDDFPTNYNEGDAERLADFIIPLCPPPRHLLYVCGLTTACHHPELAYSIKDPNGKGNQYDRVLLSVDVDLCVLS
nr:hypothetical protein [Tanacetum cinerariifolium]